MSSLISL